MDKIFALIKESAGFSLLDLTLALFLSSTLLFAISPAFINCFKEARVWFDKTNVLIKRYTIGLESSCAPINSASPLNLSRCTAPDEANSLVVIRP